MSTGQTKTVQNRPEVLVRAFRGEPVRLRVLSEKPGVVEVYRDSEQKTLGMHPSAVYRFDEDTFKKLRSAYLAGDSDMLDKVWASCSAFSQR